MRKVKLQIETLVVESFATCSHRELKGTVQGHGFTDGFEQTCELYGCPPVTWRFGATCAGEMGSCDPICNPEEPEDDFYGPTVECTPYITWGGCTGTA
ncbi:MAG TPA: hypothetical protein VFS20_32585 [Longimicrobium sp.]|nr:hypothetical protein [Longimicrobium sp.]